MVKVQPLELPQDQLNHHEVICRIRTIHTMIMNRARIILLKADGENIGAIGEKAALNQNCVLLCLKQFKEDHIEYHLRYTRKEAQPENNGR